MQICHYASCPNKRGPGKISFFRVPGEKRKHSRKIWLRHSLNKETAYYSSTKNLFICESHFKPTDFTTYGTSKKLKRDVVPLPSSSATCKCNANYIDFCCRIETPQSAHGYHKLIKAILGEGMF